MLSFYLNLIDSEEDKVKFSEIYYKYRGFVQVVVKSIVCNDDLSQDAEQEAFEKIVKYLKRIHDVDSAETKVFISVIAKSAARDLMRKERKYLEVEPVDELSCLSSGVNVENSVLQNELNRRVMALPEFYRTPIILKYYYGMKYSEIADVLHTTCDSIRKRLQRGKHALSVDIQDWSDK